MAGYRNLGMSYRGDTVAPVDGAADEPSLRTIGTDPTQAAPGNVLSQIPSDPATDTPGLRKQPRGIVGVGPGDVLGHVYPAAATSAGVTAAVTAIGANVRTLNLQAVDYAISVPASVPAGIHAVAHAGTRFVKTSTGTLHFDSFDAPPVQVFWGFAAGEVTFGAHVRVRPEWWGAKPDSDGTHGNGTDCLLAFQCAVQSSPASTYVAPVIALGVGTYRLSGKLDALVTAAPGWAKANGCHFRGMGRTVTQMFFDSSASTDGLCFSWPEQYGNGGSVRDLTIMGLGARTSARNLLVVENCSEFLASDVNVTGCAGLPLRLSGNLMTAFSRCRFQNGGLDACEVGNPIPSNFVKSAVIDAGTVWKKYNNIVALPTVTLNAGVNPRTGLTTSTRVDFPAIDADWEISQLNHFLYPTYIFGVSAKVTFSFSARTVSGTGTLYAYFADSSSKYAPAAVACALTAAQGRYYVSATLPSDGLWSASIGPDGAPYRGMPNTQPALSVLIDDAMLSVGLCAGPAPDFVATETRYCGTTTLFDQCHFMQSLRRGCIVRHDQLDVDFRSCVFEGNGAGTDTTNGHGLEIHDGTVTVSGAPYLEQNTARDIIVGDPDNLGLVGARVTIEAPKLFGGWNFNDPTKGGILFRESTRCAFVTGGCYGDGLIDYPVKVDPYVLKVVKFDGLPKLLPTAEYGHMPVDATTLKEIPIGNLEVSATVGSESGDAIEVACKIVDSLGTQIKATYQVDIESLAVTDGQGAIAAAGTPVGTLVRAYNPAAGPCRAAMTTTTNGLFSFKISDTAAESVSVRISAAGVTPLVLLLTFA